MNRITKPSNLSLCITNFSFRFSIDLLAKHLSFLARQAYSVRDYNLVKAISQELLHLSPKSEPLGHYYQGLVLARALTGDIKGAEKIFHALIDCPQISIRAAATLATGYIEYAKGNLQDARRLFTLSHRLSVSKDICAPVVTLQSASAVALIAEAIGDQNQVALLSSLIPLAERIGCVMPAVRDDYFNNYAVELSRSGNLVEASHYIQRATSSPFAKSFPDWQETQLEIEAKLNPLPSKQVSRALIQRQQEKAKVLLFPERPKHLVTIRIMADIDGRMEPLKRLYISPNNLPRLSHLFNGLNALTGQGASLNLVIQTLNEQGVLDTIVQPILRANFDNLFLHLRQIERSLKQESSIAKTAAATDVAARKTDSKIVSLIRQSS